MSAHWSLGARILALPVRAYRRFLSPLKPPTCRFVPTCSHYALDALRQHGSLRGSWLTLRRLCRCHPWGGSGFDPVPTRNPSPTASPRKAIEADAANDT